MNSYSYHNYNNRLGRRGSTTTVVLVIIAIIVVVAIFLSLSKPWGQKAKTAWQGATEWTAENIQKDPAAYLAWAIDEIKASQNKLEARAIALGVKREEWTQRRDENTLLLKKRKELLASGMKAYKESEQTNQWPDTWEGLPVGSQQAFEQILVEVDSRRANAEKLAGTYATLAQRVNVKLAEIKDARSKATLTEQKIKTDLEVLKANQTLGEINDIGSTVNEILNTAKQLVTTDRTLDDVESEKTQADRSSSSFAQLKAQY